MDDKAIIQAAYEEALQRVFITAFAGSRLDTDKSAMENFRESYLLLLDVREAALDVIEEHTNADADSPA